MSVVNNETPSSYSDGRTGKSATTMIDARYYTDPAIFELEQDKIFAKTWQYACPVSELPKIGSYKTFEIAGENLFAIRGKDGQIRSFYNVCQHRAHRIVQGVGRTRSLVCPYHAWSYELDGGLRSAPNHEAVEGFDLNKICLTEIRTELFCGLVFVNLDPNAKDMAEVFPGVEDEIRAFVPQVDDLAPMRWVGVPEKCNWKVSVENYSECYHCALNHPTFVNGVVDPDSYNVMPEGKVLRHYTKSAGLEKMTYEIDTEANEHALEYSSWFLWPTISFQVYPGNVLNTYHWYPETVDSTMVWRAWFTIGGHRSDVIDQLADQDFNTTVAEDITLVESVQKGLNSRGFKPAPLVIDPKDGVNSEHSIRALNEWTLEALGN